MARLTYAQIKTYGGLVGQNDAVSTWVDVKMKAWLRKHYAAWPWPFLIKQATSISMVAGTTSLNVGAGNSSLTDQICRLFSPVFYRANSFSTRGKAPLRTIVGGPPEMAYGNVDTASQVGTPIQFTALPQTDSAGKMYFALQPYAVPDIQYYLAFTYQKMPDDPAESDVPIYPNEMTLIQAAKVAALEYDRTGDPIYQQEANTLAAMVSADRDTYGGAPMFGDTLQLDDDMFPTTSTDYLNKLPFV